MAQPVWNKNTTGSSIPLSRRFKLTGIPHPGQAPWPGAIRPGIAVTEFKLPPVTFNPFSVISTLVDPIIVFSLVTGANNGLSSVSETSPGVIP